MSGKNLGRQVVGGFGTLVWDWLVCGLVAGWLEIGGKHTVTVNRRLGGGLINVMRAARQLGTVVAPYGVVGDDDFGGLMAGEFRQEFPPGTVLRNGDVSRMSLLLDRACLTTRSPLEFPRMWNELKEQIAACEVFYVAPGLPEDRGFLEEVLEAAKFSVLALSGEQLDDPDTLGLIRAADLVVLNKAEARRLDALLALDLPRDERTPEAMIRRLRDEGVAGILITGRDRVAGFHDGNWISEAAFDIAEVVEETGAGDCFVGTLCAALAKGKSLRQAVELGLAAAALHVEGQGHTIRWDVLESMPATRPRVAFQPPPIPPRVRPALVRAAVILLSLLVGQNLWSTFS